MPSAPSPSRTLFASPLVRFGAFRCPPHDPLWQHENCIGDGHNLVFPRNFVEIRAAGQPTLVTSPNITMLYNCGQRYERRLVTPDGDACEWIVPRRDLLIDVLTEHDPATGERGEQPFRTGHAPSDARAYLLQRRVYHALHAGGPVDALAVEEALLEAVRRQLVALYEHAPVTRRRRGASTRRDRALVDTVRRLLARRFAEPLTLDALAAAGGCSVFHLCRVFRQSTGSPLHRYLRRLRVRAALQALPEPGVELVTLALDVGFSSQSHFTDAFRTEFGVAPARLRRMLRAGDVRSVPVVRTRSARQRDDGAPR